MEFLSCERLSSCLQIWGHPSHRDEASAHNAVVDQDLASAQDEALAAQETTHAGIGSWSE